MSICLLAFAITLGCTGGRDAPTVTSVERAQPADRWLAEDKLQHFTLSFAATQLAYGGARFALEPETAVAVAASGALGLGIAKELRDVRAGGPFSLKDLAWDAAGIALGVAFVRRIR